MKSSVVCVVACAAISPNEDPQWVDFKTTYDKVYNGEAEQKHYDVFTANVAYIEAENAKEQHHKLGINQFTDLSREEFALQFMGYKKPDLSDVTVGTHSWGGEDLPDQVDWVVQGAVTPVKTQGSCGSCWSFSTTGAMEGAYQIASGKLVSLSEQQYMDCDHFPNLGCHGGTPDFSLRWSKNNDLCSEESYPYEAKNGECRAKGCTVAIPKGTVTSVKDVALVPQLVPATEKNLMSAVAQQPVSVAVAAGNDEFQHYKSGVLTKKCGSTTPPKPDHAVLITGYGTDPDGGDYWTIKNSWGAVWGESGSLRIQRGGTDKYGLCGVLTNPVFPVINKQILV